MILREQQQRLDTDEGGIDIVGLVKSTGLVVDETEDIRLSKS